MSEAGFHLFNRAFPIVVELFYALCLALFLRPFLGERRGRKAAVFTLYLVASLAWEHLPAPQGTSTLIVVMLLVAVSGFLGIKQAMAFLLGLLFWNAKIASALTVESLYFVADRLTPQPMDPPEAVYLRGTLLLTLLILSHAVVLTAMLGMLQRQLKKRVLALTRREVCYLGLIPAAGVLFGQIISNLLFEVKDGILLELYERHPAFLAGVPVLALLFYAGAYMTVAFQQDMDTLQEEREILFVERRQTQVIRERIGEMEQFYAQVRELKHEMRGHLTNLKGLCSAGEYGSLGDYILKMDDSISEFDLTVQTGNPVTDVIVNDVQQKCQKLGVGFQPDFHYPVTGGYDAFDVGIILQNLLQNALEACGQVSEERFITLTGKRQGRFFLIEVQNSFAGRVIFGPDGLPVTTKTADAPLHGIGLANVRREAEKYMGDLEIKTEQQVFCVTVLLQANQQGGERDEYFQHQSDHGSMPINGEAGRTHKS